MKKLESKEKAYKLFILGMDHVDIAHTFDVDVRTITNWAKQGKWRERLAQQLLERETNEESIQKLIVFQLLVLDKIRAESEVALDEVLADSDLDRSKRIETLQSLLTERTEIDAIQKLYTMIRGKDIEWTMYVKVMREFVSEVHNTDLKLAKELIDPVNEFLGNKRKELL